jgi:[ribosomal protein S18]-alanine N-acetyltransferase
VNGYELRGYRKSDLDALVQLDEVCFAPQFRFTRAMMRRFAEDAKARVVIAEQAEEFVGFCIVHIERQNSGYVVTLDVDPAHRRSGIASLLMQRAEVTCRSAGCLSMMLHVFTGNTAAIHFYERNGYVRSSTAVDFYGAGANAFVYRKSLK